MLGWIYARALIKNEKLWGGPAPITLVQLDDFILWVTLGIILGGRTGYVLFYNPAFFIAASRRDFRTVEGRHVVSRRLSRLRRRGDAVLRARTASPILSLGDITTAVGPIGLFLGRLANFINSELWGRAGGCQRALGDGVPQWPVRLPRHPSQLYEAALEGILLFAVLAVMIRMGALKRPGLILGSFIAIYAFARITRRIVPGAGPAARIFVGRADHGYAVVGADDHCRSHPDCDGMAPQGAGACAEVNLSRSGKP